MYECIIGTLLHISLIVVFGFKFISGQHNPANVSGPYIRHHGTALMVLPSYGIKQSYRNNSNITTYCHPQIEKYDKT